MSFRDRERDRERDMRPPARRPSEIKIDRQKVCPLLLRVYTGVGAHHKEEDFDGKVPSGDEIAIYTWKDATLKELTDLVKTQRKEARAPRARLSWAFVYPDPSGRNAFRLVGTTYSHSRSIDDGKTLAQLRFETGDYIDVAIFSK